MKLLWTSIAGALLSLCFALPANASALTFFEIASSQTNERFTVSCTLGCDAWEGTTPTTWGTDGDLFSLTSSGDQDEVDAVNTITGESYTKNPPDFTKTDRGGASSVTFTSSAEYILLKIGFDPNYGLIRNALAGNVFTFTSTGPGAGFSHSSEFGTVSPVPVPAAVWLFGTALIGFIGFSRRTKV